MMTTKVKVTEERLLAVVAEVMKGQNTRSEKLIQEITALILRKNQDYADAWQRYGIFTPLVRLNDKLLRVANLSDGKPMLVAEEGLEETLRDIAGYAFLALLYMEHVKSCNG